jgi:hypothetical protein
VVQEGRKDGLRVEPGKAAPDDFAAPLYQRGKLAVPDEAKVFEAHQAKYNSY